MACAAVVGVLSAAGLPAAESKTADTLPVWVSTKGKAARWSNLEQLQKFAQAGDAAACLELGGRYLEGEGVPRNPARAITLLEVAAKGGFPDALFRLGKIYHDGIGVPIDYPRALVYFIPAAQAKVMEAQHNIGAMLVSARGVKRNYAEGLAWLIVAAKAGDPSDAETQVRRRLSRSPSVIAAAEARAGEILEDLGHAAVVGAPNHDSPPAVIAPKLEMAQPVVTPLKAPGFVPPPLAAPGPFQLTPPVLPDLPVAPPKS